MEMNKESVGKIFVLSKVLMEDIYPELEKNFSKWCRERDLKDSLPNLYFYFRFTEYGQYYIKLLNKQIEEEKNK